MAVKSKEDEMFDAMAKELARKIDESVMSTVLVKSGWIPVPFEFKDNNHAIDVHIWLQNTCVNGYTRYDGSYLFKSKEEAEWFILRWS